MDMIWGMDMLSSEMATTRSGCMGSATGQGRYHTLLYVLPVSGTLLHQRTLSGAPVHQSAHISAIGYSFLCKGFTD